MPRLFIVMLACLVALDIFLGIPDNAVGYLQMFAQAALSMAMLYIAAREADKYVRDIIAKTHLAVGGNHGDDLSEL